MAPGVSVVKEIISETDSARTGKKLLKMVESLN